MKFHFLSLALYLGVSLSAAHAQRPADIQRIDSLNQRANSFRGNHPDSMIAIAELALNQAKATGYKKGQAEAMRWIALGKNLTGQSGSEELLRTSYNILKDIDDKSALATTLNTMATVYFYKGDYKRAGERWHEALAIHSSMGDSVGITNMWNNLGNLHRALGQNDVALSYHERTLRFRETKTDTLNLAGSLNNVANLLNELKRHDEALMYHERALGLNMAIGNRRSIGNSLMNLGSTHLRRGNPELALSFYRQAADIRESMKDIRSLSGVYSGMADAFISMNNPREASVWAQKAYDLAVQVNVPREANDASRFAYIANRDMGNTAVALRFLEIHKSLSDSLMSIDRQKAIANLESVAELNRLQEELNALEMEKFYGRIILAIIVVSLIGAITALVYIRRSQLELRRLGAMKDRMFSILSHDLRSPLNSLHSMIELMDMDALTTDEWKSFKDTLMRQFDVTDETLRDVLLWAKGQFEGEKPRIQSVNLLETVESNVELVNLIASRKGVTIHVDVAGDAAVLVDKAHLMAIIRNLLTNAVKFTPSGKSVRLRSQRADNTQVLFIEDEGVGMSPEKVASLFTTAGQITNGTDGESGSGLGLVFVRDLMRRNKGTIQASSRLGAGSTFTISLPSG